MAYLKVKDYEAALEDCQTLAENYKMDADLYFLTGETALAMDSYEEASANFEQAYGEDATYDRAIQIYGAYLNRDMEADGTRYLEAALSGTAKMQRIIVTAAEFIIIWMIMKMLKVN